MRFTLVVLLALACAFVVALSVDASKPRALVLLDSLDLRTTHSRFFQHLNSLYDLDIKEASDSDIELSQHGSYLYEALIHLAPAATEFGLITVDDVLNFIDDGHSMLLVGDSEISDSVREIALECGIEFEDDATVVVDHFGFDKSDFDGSHTLLVADNWNKGVPVVTGKVDTPALYRGVGHTLERNNKLLIPILRASRTAYSTSEASDLHHSTKGSELALISALQARNNARVTVAGSLDFFSDKFYQSGVEKYTAEGQAKSFSKSANEDFAKTLISWTFGQRGVLRSSNVRHRSLNRQYSESGYTIKDEIEYTVDVEEKRDGKWVPYTGKDVQLEFVMLNPYVRTFLNKTGDAAQYKAVFRLPDVYGIFTFRLNYNRVGYTSLSEIERVTVRPLRHDQYDRFIVAAYPYYASSFSMMVGLFIFGVFFLYTKDKKQ